MDENDESYSRKGEEDSIVDDDSIQGDKKNSEYMFPVSFPFSRGFYFYFNIYPSFRGVLFLFLFQFFCFYGYLSTVRPMGPENHTLV